MFKDILNNEQSFKESQNSFKTSLWVLTGPQQILMWSYKIINVY